MRAAPTKAEDVSDVGLHKRLDALELSLRMHLEERLQCCEERQHKLMDDLFRQHMASLLKAMQTGGGLCPDALKLEIHDTTWTDTVINGLGKCKNVEEPLEQDSGTASTTARSDSSPKNVRDGAAMNLQDHHKGEDEAAKPETAVAPAEDEAGKPEHSKAFRQPMTAADEIMEELGEVEEARSKLQRISQNKHLHAFVMVCIIVQSFCLGWEVHVDMQNRKAIYQMHQPVSRGLADALASVGNVFNIFFAVEVAFRLLVFRKEFFFGEDSEACTWNVFDLALVLLSITDFVDTEIGNIGFLRSIRMLRVVRVLRVVHVFAELRRMIYALMHCLLALFWLCVLLWLILYMFALAFMQGVADHLRTVPPAKGGAEEQMLLENFGDIGHGVLCLFAAITGGNE